ncbi:hypothetical protein [Paenibacillus camelliae]|uniref:hypothetical protein n=1 Tax=Paenibacillus camelliae TaxID=512410 RepID=UPI00203D971B|nr:hypothetical protein [Paenibacillus camelliae]MCM3632915.1 hypothetical protein [Paenibacillus camelliae]
MIIVANQIKVGTQLAEASGMMYSVVEIIKETEKSITVRLCNDMASFKEHWTIKPNGEKGGAIKTYRKTTKLYGLL